MQQERGGAPGGGPECAGINSPPVRAAEKPSLQETKAIVGSKPRKRGISQAAGRLQQRAAVAGVLHSQEDTLHQEKQSTNQMFNRMLSAEINSNT